MDKLRESGLLSLAVVFHAALDRIVHGGRQEVNAACIPAEKDGQSDRDAEKDGIPAVDQPVYPQQDQREHVDPVDPHQVAGLREVVLHKAAAERKDQHKTGLQFPDPLLQIDSHSAGTGGHFQPDDDIEKYLYFRLGEEEEKQIEGGRQIITENTGGILAERAAEGIPDRLLSRQDVFKPAQKIQILVEGISPHKSIGAFPGKRKYLQAPADNDVNDECKQCGEGRYESFRQTPAPCFFVCCIHFGLSVNYIQVKQKVRSNNIRNIYKMKYQSFSRSRG